MASQLWIKAPKLEAVLIVLVNYFLIRHFRSPNLSSEIPTPASWPLDIGQCGPWPNRKSRGRVSHSTIVLGELEQME